MYMYISVLVVHEIHVDDNDFRLLIDAYVIPQP